MRLKDKVAIITGAGSGIGRMTALIFAKEGAKVLVADITNEGQKTAEEIKETGGSAIFVKTDVSKTVEVNEMVETCLKEFGQIDILVNNAGIVRFSKFHETSEQDWDETMAVDLKGVFLCSKAVLPEMIKRGAGKIINISSIAGLVGFNELGAYCAAKGAIIALTREMALEYAPLKININCIAPGVIKTAMTKDMLADPQTKQFLESSTLYPRFGEPEDIAYAALYLASNESDFINGEVLVVDGGWTIK